MDLEEAMEEVRIINFKNSILKKNSVYLMSHKSL